MEHIVPDRLFERQLIEKCMWPMLGHILKSPEFNFGLGDLSLDPDADKFMLPQSHLPDESAHPAPNLCGACNGITMDALEMDFGYLHSRDVRDLLHSAQSCPLCDMIRRQICRAVKYHVRTEEDIADANVAINLFAMYMAENNCSLAEPIPVILKRDSGGHEGPSLMRFVAIGTLVANPGDKRGIGLALYWGRMQLHGSKDDCQLPLLPRGNDEQVLERLRVWLQVREEEVPSWSDAGGDRPLPTRVLDLRCQDGEGTQSGEDKIRLVETAGDCGQYVALSYCWGGYTACRTLKGSYTDRCRNITVTNLPPLFVQAIRVTRGLGIRYLWIDALCIIQDDPEDWKREAASMFNVYSNTVCRIAVNDCKSPLESFFPPRDIVASVRVPGLLADAATRPTDMAGEEMEWEHSSDESIGDDALGQEDGDLQRAIRMSLQNNEMVSLKRYDTLEVFQQDQEDEDEAEILEKAIAMSLQTDDIAEPETDTEDRFSVALDPNIQDDDRTNGNASIKTDNTELKTNATAEPEGDSSKTLEFSVFQQDGHFIRRLASCEDATDSSNLLIESLGQRFGSWDRLEEPSHPLEEAVGEHEYFPAKSDRGQRQLNDNEPAGPRLKGKARKQPQGMYLTIPKAYQLEVDRGVLNTRAWVLQERLLAPRTIHFTVDHIYCEDQDDICGEDWVKRYFTWLSCIDKTAILSPLNLFPERGFASNDAKNIDSFATNSIWWLRSMYRSSETHHVPDPWLRICEKYSRCNLSVQTDRLAAFAGLVKKYPGYPEAHSNENNLLGLWEGNLHVELLWYATRHSKLKYRQELNLPSWAWIAYDGRIFFTKEGRTGRDAKTVKCAPVAEFVLTTSNVPDMMATLPLCVPATLTLCVSIRDITSTSRTTTEFDFERRSRRDLAASTPFNFDPRTGAVPASITGFSYCHEIFDDVGKLIGFVSFDEEGTPSGDLFCAHISTLFDEAHGEAMRQFDDHTVHKVDLNDFRTPILAYALVMVKVSGSNSDFRRVGICEVNYEWMSGGTQEMVRLL